MEISLPYLAGLLDGEGCLMITALRNYREARRRVRYDPVMQIVNTYLPLLQLVQLQYGGRIQVQRKDCFGLYFSANEMRRILPKLLPFLVIKKNQAEVLLRFLELKRSVGCRRIPESVFGEYEQHYGTMKEMKHERFSLTPSIRESQR